MNLSQLAEILKNRVSDDTDVRDRWLAAVDRLLEAAEAPASFSEVADRLPPKARYVGPGPWLDTIRDSYKQQ